MSIFIHRVDPAELATIGARTLMGQLGINVTEQGSDYLRATMPVDTRTHQPIGLLHGGASAALAETLGSHAAALTLPEGALPVGIELNINHLRAVRSGIVTGTATPLHLGRTTQVWEIRIVDERERLIAISRLTVAVLDRSARAAES